MLISVVTINKNNCQGLEQTMQSVLQQDWKPLEYIVIDGGSTDGSVALLKRFANQLHYWETAPDQGVYNAQNKGLSKANGDYILFLNSADTFCEPGSLSELAKIIKSKKKTIVYGDLLVTSSDGNHWLKTYPDQLPSNYFDYETLPHPASLIPTTLLKAEGGYDASMKISADWKFFRELFIHKKAGFIHVPKAISVFDNTGMSSLQSQQKLIAAEKEKVKRESPVPKSLRQKTMGTLRKIWKA